MLAGFPVAGGGPNELADSFAPEDDSILAHALRPVFRKLPRDGYFLRAEFLAHFATLLDIRRKDPLFTGDPYQRYGGKSLHRQSHGESFLSVLGNRIQSGLFLFDEPEAALSPQRLLALMIRMQELTQPGKIQFIIATHSPILLTFPRATIVSFDSDELPQIDLRETSHYQLTRGILENPIAYWNHLRSSETQKPTDECES